VKSLNAAVDEVRKEQWRAASAQDRKVLKGLRWLLYRHSSTRTKGQTRILNALRRGNIRIHRAWVLKDEFEHFWDYSSLGPARTFITRWGTTALRSRREPLRQFVQTLRKYEEHILTFVETGLTNAVAEGVNRVIRMVKNSASGFSSLAAFSDLIFLTIGDVDILGTFPNTFRVP
jgi:transposase